MKHRFAVVALLACSFPHAAFAADSGIEMVMLNDNPTPAPGDRIAFKELQGKRCSYFGIVQAAGNVAISRKRCPGQAQALITMNVPLNKGPAGTTGQKQYKAYPVEGAAPRKTE